MSLELEVWQAPIVDDEGNIQPGAQITVWDAETNESSTIFDDLDRSPKSNPFTVGSDGLARFYAEPGRYRIQAQVGSEIAVYDDVDLSQKSHRNDLSSLDPDKGGVLVRRNVIAVDSIADLLALPAAARRADLRVDVASRNNVTAQSIGGGQYRWDALSEKRDNGDTVLAVSGVSVGRWIKISGQISEDLEILIPTDYDNLQGAVDDLSKFIPCKGAAIDIVIQETYEPVAGVSVSTGDYSHFLISSELSIVHVASSYDGDFIRASNGAKSPVLNCLIDANKLGADGLHITDSAEGYVNGGCGVINAGGRGLYCNNSSTVFARGSEFSGAWRRGLWVTRNSRADIENSKFNYCNESLDTNTSNTVRRNSSVNAQGAEFDNNFNTGINASRASSLNLAGASVSHNAGRGVQSERASLISLSGSGDAVVNNNEQEGVRAFSGGFVEAEGIECKDNGSSSDFVADTGIIFSRGATITGDETADDIYSSLSDGEWVEAGSDSEGLRYHIPTQVYEVWGVYTADLETSGIQTFPKPMGLSLFGGNQRFITHSFEASPPTNQRQAVISSAVTRVAGDNFSFLCDGSGEGTRQFKVFISGRQNIISQL